jgi:hypothetical protein
MVAIVNASLIRIVAVMVFAGFTRTGTIVKLVTGVSTKGRN